MSCKILEETYFSWISRDDLFFLDKKKTSTIYEAGQIIFHEGAYPNGIFCVQSGKLKIYKEGKDGRSQIVRLATPGMFLGIRSLLGREKYAASAMALEDSAVCFVNRSDFFEIIAKYPKIAENLMTNLSKLLLEAEEKILSIAQNPVRQRLAEALLILGKIYCEDDENKKQGSICMSREDLANIVGTATESVIRILSEFKEDKLIATKGRRIIILDSEKLNRIMVS